METVETEVVEPKKKRGRETAGDMVRSLGLVMLMVVGIWWLAQPPDSDEKRLRVVDPASSVSSFAAAQPTVPVPGALPDRWRPNVATVGAEPDTLRVGWVTPSEEYAEYAASSAPADEFVAAVTGPKAQRLEPVLVAGAPWDSYRDEDGSLSLVRSYGAVTVVVGTARATASVDELRVLAESLATR